MDQSTQKKILIFSLAYYPKYIGGAEIAIKEITDRINPNEIEFHMVTNRFDSILPKVEKVGNILVHRIGFTERNPTISDLRKFPLHLNKILFQFLAAHYAHKLNKKYNYDAIWAMMAHSTGVPAGIFKKKHPNIQYILTLQEGDPIDYIKKKMRPFRSLFTRAFTSADKVQTISIFLAQWAREMGFRGKVDVIPNAVNVKRFTERYTENEMREIKNTLNKKDNDIVMITTSRLVKKNAIDSVIESLTYLPDNIKFLIIGVGPDEKMLKDLAKERGVSKRVMFIGEIDNKNLPKYLKASDIFVRPSRSEGMGISFLEAMASELPVIATQEGGISDFLYDAKRNPDKNTTGWAVDKNSPEQIAKAVKDIIAYPDKVREVTKTAYAMVLLKYDWDIIARDMKNKVFKAIF